MERGQRVETGEKGGRVDKGLNLRYEIRGESTRGARAEEMRVRSRRDFDNIAVWTSTRAREREKGSERLGRVRGRG